MSCKLKRPLSIQFMIILGTLTLMMSSGCTMGQETRATDHAQHMVALEQQGQFTKAVILQSLHDSTSFNLGTPERDVAMSQNDGMTLPGEGQAETGHESGKHVGPPSPLLVHLTPDRGPKTGLDEKWHSELGWSLLVDGNYEGAVAAYREALRQNQDSAEAYVGLGSALKMQNEASAAIEAYEQALHLQPDNPAALVHLGAIYADGAPEHRNVEKAKQLYSRASQQGDPFATMALRDLNTRQ